MTKFDDVKLSGFLIIRKLSSAHLCEPIHDIIFTCLFESGKCGKEDKKLQKF